MRLSYQNEVSRLVAKITMCERGLSCTDIAIGSGGLGFYSRAGQIGHSVANGSPPLRRFFGAALPSSGAAMNSATCYTLWRNNASITKI